MSIAVIMWSDPELETGSVWDQELNTDGIVVLSQPTRRYPEIQSKTSGQSNKLFQLKKKIGSLEVMI